MDRTNMLKQMRRTKPNMQQEMRRDENAWRGLEGVWRNKTVTDPVRWQKKIRKEWQRALP